MSKNVNVAGAAFHAIMKGATMQGLTPVEAIGLLELAKQEVMDAANPQRIGKERTADPLAPQQVKPKRSILERLGLKGH